MGLKSRTKGKAFERKIARAVRVRWPDALVRRASQAERAYQSDVFIERGPELLSKLWLECQDARNPTPLKKLQQAEWDVEEIANDSWPIVVWHKLGERTVQATMRLSTLAYLDNPRGGHQEAPELVTMDLDSFMRVVERAIAKGA